LRKRITELLEFGTRQGWEVRIGFIVFTS